MTSARPIAVGLLMVFLASIVWLFRESWDVALYWSLHLDAAGRLRPVLTRLTEVGGAASMIPVALAGFGHLLLTRRRQRALWLFATIASGRAIVELAKVLCARARPTLLDRLVPVSSLSFPSSHSAGTMLTGLALCTAYSLGAPFRYLAVLFSAAIGLTRIALGVHWPTDVIGGWGLGLLWVGLCRGLLPADRDTAASASFGSKAPAAGGRSAALAIAGLVAILALITLLRLPVSARELRRIPASDARQGAAADPTSLFAIADRTISRLERATGRVAVRTTISLEGLSHLNSCVASGGRLTCAVSNYPKLPMAGAIVSFDAQSLQLVGVHRFDRPAGSPTWATPRDGDWWTCFANYDGRGGSPGRDHRATRIVRYDRHWQAHESYALPEAVLQRLAPRSASGGAWGSDGFLYISGHDRPEVYVLRIPRAGLTLELVTTLPTASSGQAIAWDPTAPDVLWGINRARRLLIATRIDAASAGDRAKTD